MAKVVTMHLTVTVESREATFKEIAEFFEEVIEKGREQGSVSGHIEWPAHDEEIE